jgi:hypothetical protein
VRAQNRVDSVVCHALPVAGIGDRGVEEVGRELRGDARMRGFSHSGILLVGYDEKRRD